MIDDRDIIGEVITEDNAARVFPTSSAREIKDVPRAAAEFAFEERTDLLAQVAQLKAEREQLSSEF